MKPAKTVPFPYSCTQDNGNFILKDNSYNSYNLFGIRVPF